MDYWEEKKKEHERAIAFMEEVKPGDVVQVERYGYPMFHPYSMEEQAYIVRERLTVYAMDKRGLYFTATNGNAYDAAAMVKWRVIKPEPTLF